MSGSSSRVFRGPSAPFRALVGVPGDKSLAHRAVIFGAIADGITTVRGLPAGDDVASTIGALRALGVRVDEDGDTVRVHGRPDPSEWQQAAQPIDCGNSGTTMRLLAGVLAALPFPTTLTGDRSLRSRPMRRLQEPLQALGAHVETTGGMPPITITGGSLIGTRITLPIASAQVRTAVAIAALRASGPTLIDSPIGFRDHTERWLHALGRGSGLDPGRFEVEPGGLPPLDVELPGDASSAAFLWAAAALSAGSSITTPSVTLNPGRTGFIDVIRDMGGSVDVTPSGDILGDPVGDVTVHGEPLRALRVSGSSAVAALDELPLVGVLGAHAEGTTVVADAAELRVKESDRVAATVALIADLGGAAEARPDGFAVTGTRLTGGTADARGDHRIAMAAAVAATVGCRVEVKGFGASRVSWPGFAGILEDAWASSR